MDIREITFVKGSTSWSGLPSDGLPEVAFAGRSNVGKSSLLNALAGRRALARTSRTPGKTREFNHYLVNESLYFVDLPGFGYAKVSKRERAHWARLIERYIAERDMLRLVVHLVDSRHEPGVLDRSFIEFMCGSDVPYAIALTKCDKLSGNDRVKTEHRMHETLSTYGLEIPIFLTLIADKTGLARLVGMDRDDGNHGTMTKKMKVLITDAVDPICIDMLEARGITPDVRLKQSGEALRKAAAEADGWIIRSGTTITADLIEAASNLRAIGRAGVGVDNIDLAAATRRGVLVINAPSGNTISTAEHTCALLLSMARRVPQANRSIAEGKWDRKSFTGSEVYEKTLGVVGLGKIGREVAVRMAGFGMNLIGYDPVLSQEAAERLGVRLVDMDELLAGSDFITVHTPLNDATRSLLRKETFARCRKGVCIVNCARGGIVEEKDLLAALDSGQVGGVALDVYSTEPPPAELNELLKHPKVIATPHIAASTEEAQEKVAVQITEQVIRALCGEAVHTPVNALAIKMASQPDVQPYLSLSDRLGQLIGQLGAGRIRGITVGCRGDVPRRYSEVLTVAAVRGILSKWVTEPVNLINAPFLAEDMGIHVTEARDTAPGGYTNLLQIGLETDDGARTVAGTIFDRDEPRLVRIDNYWLEIKPEGHMIVYRNVDRPGMLAAVGSILARNDINIGALALGRAGKGEIALTAVTVDEAVPATVVGEIAALDGIEDVRRVDV